MLGLTFDKNLPYFCSIKFSLKSLMKVNFRKNKFIILSHFIIMKIWYYFTVTYVTHVSTWTNGIMAAGRLLETKFCTCVRGYHVIVYQNERMIWIPSVAAKPFHAFITLTVLRAFMTLSLAALIAMTGISNDSGPFEDGNRE